MFYNYLKIIHILSAGLFITGIVYCYTLWKKAQQPDDIIHIAQRIQTQSWLLIIPAGLFQLMTGFTMISLKHYHYSQTWIAGSVIGFIIVITSWFSFIYFLLLSQQLVSQVQNSQSSHVKFIFFRRIQSIMLFVCMTALLSMVFFMANKT